MSVPAAKIEPEPLVSARVKVRPKAQLTLPEEIRRALHISEGDEVEFAVHDDGTITVRGYVSIPTDQAWFFTPRWLAGERGVVQAQIQLSPERPPRVQSLTLAVPPAAGSPLGNTLAAVVAWLNGSDGNDGTDRYWPDAIPVADAVDASLLARRLRMAAVWAGPARLGAYRAGDGAASVAVELVGEHATLTLTLVVDPASGVLRQADLFP